jgi:hypothetical protein
VGFNVKDVERIDPSLSIRGFQELLLDCSSRIRDSLHFEAIGVGLGVNQGSVGPSSYVLLLNEERDNGFTPDKSVP